MKHKKENKRKCTPTPSPLIITLISLSLFLLLLFTNDITLIARITLRLPLLQLQTPQQTNHITTILDHHQPNNNGEEHEHEHEHEQEQEQEEEEATKEHYYNSCDLSKGKWVFDNVTRPLYKEDECGFLTAQVTCIKNGREDRAYQKWRWQPNHCSLPTFEARILLEKLRGKKLLFVGDSVNRNQWESLICLLQTGVSPARATWKMGAPLSVYSIQDYNATVEFYWAPFLVESNSDDPRNHSISQRIIIPESISKHGIHWKDADFLVFNSYIWWMNGRTIKALRSGSFDQGSPEYEEIERPTAYERVLTTWANWINDNMDRTRTSAFFITMSPVHQQSSNWDKPDGNACASETDPISKTSTPLDMGTDRRLLEVTKNVIEETGVPVRLVDITTLSEYRKDGHTSVYTIRQGKLLTPEQKADPATYADCLHWCLPGVPDTWNELLYAYIIS